MAINMVPEFTSDEPQAVEERVEETLGKEATEESAPSVEEEKETPSEPPAEEKPDEETLVEDTRTAELERSHQRLSEERVKLLREVAELRGQKREIKQEQLDKVSQAIDDLKDVHPEDVKVIEKVIRSKGYIRSDEAKQMWYDSVKNEELNKFLEKYPEYKPENDKNDLNWSSFQKELGFYRMPEDPHAVGQILDRAHKAISTGRVSSERGIVQRQRQIQNAGVGKGGTQRSSPSITTLDPEKRFMLKQGGWSEEEISKMEQKLSE